MATRTTNRHLLERGARVRHRDIGAVGTVVAWWRGCQACGQAYSRHPLSDSGRGREPCPSPGTEGWTPWRVLVRWDNTNTEAWLAGRHLERE